MKTNRSQISDGRGELPICFDRVAGPYRHDRGPAFSRFAQDPKYGSEALGVCTSEPHLLFFDTAPSRTLRQEYRARGDMNCRKRGDKK